MSRQVSRESAPARVTLGVTTVLTITTLITTTNRAMPPVSYVKAVDIYLSVCYFMVFAALLEFALVSYSGKRLKVQSPEDWIATTCRKGIIRGGAVATKNFGPRNFSPKNLAGKKFRSQILKRGQTCPTP